MLESVVVQEDRLTNIEQAIVEMKTMLQQRFDAVDRRFDAMQVQMDRRFEETHARMDRRFEETHAEMDRRFDETQAQLKSLIEDVRDDVRIVAEGHVALEKRVTALENRPQ